MEDKMENPGMERISNKADTEDIDPLLAIGDELAIDILIRLPLKTLFRSKCVSTRWKHLISDPYFAYVYVNRQAGGSHTHTTTPVSFFCQLDPFAHAYGYGPLEDKSLHFLRLDNGVKDENDDNHVVMQHRVRALKLNFSIVDSCNGLLLFTGTGKLYYYVSNLISKQWVALPQPKGRHPYQSAKLVHNYDDSYKPSLTQMKFEVLLFSHYMSLLSVEIFSSETGKWKMVRLPYYPSYLSTLRCHSLFNGVAYWLVTHAGHGFNIAALDFSHLKASRPLHLVPRNDFVVLPGGCVQSIPLPASSDYPCNGFLGFSGGLLHYAESNLTNLRIWALSGGGPSQSSQVEWSLKLRVSLQFMIDEHPDIFQSITTGIRQLAKRHKFHFTPLAFHPSGLHLVLLRLPGMIVSYHIEKGKLEVVHHYNVRKFQRFAVLSFNHSAWPTRLPLVRNDFPFWDTLVGNGAFVKGIHIFGLTLDDGKRCQ